MKDVDDYCNNIIAAAKCLKNYKNRQNPFDASLFDALINAIQSNYNLIIEINKEFGVKQSAVRPNIEKATSALSSSQPRSPVGTTPLSGVSDLIIKGQQTLNKGQQTTSIIQTQEDKFLKHLNKILDSKIVNDLIQISSKDPHFNLYSTFEKTLNCTLPSDSLKSEDYKQVLSFLKTDEFKNISPYFDESTKEPSHSILYFLLIYLEGLKKISNPPLNKETNYFELVVQLSHLTIFLIVNIFKSSNIGSTLGRIDLSSQFNSPNIQVYHLKNLQKLVLSKFVTEYSTKFSLISPPNDLPSSVTNFLHGEAGEHNPKTILKSILVSTWEKPEDNIGRFLAFLNFGLKDSNTNMVRISLFAIVEKEHKGP